MGNSDTIEQIELNLEQVYQGVQGLKDETHEQTESKMSTKKVQVRVGLTEHERKMISDVKLIMLNSNDLRNCSTADVLRLALQLLETNSEDEIRQAFNKVKSFNKRRIQT